ncbi:MAG: hypothetical protein LUH05_04215 [Candidatus Gastranaerophilales bacterium]|nr:hypothetical protein [Candidatus Gastranaerophilales bacterium]
MACNNCQNFHISTGLTYTAGTSLIIAVTNSTNTASKQPFCFVIKSSDNISNTVTGDPVNVFLTVNGNSANLYNKYHLPVTSDELTCRKLYKGWYVNDGTNAWVELANFPICGCN